MKEISNILYGKTNLSLLADDSTQVLETRLDELGSERGEDEIVEDAMRSPIDSLPLYELAKGKKTATVIISDHTRPVPSRHILPFMLAELRKGNPEIEITLLVATGCHRGTKEEELRAKLGEEIFNREKIIVHDSENKESNVNIGVLPSGANLIIDKAAVETDLLVAEGFIEPHFFAGYSGGRKSVLPGICDRVTVHGNHCAKFIASPYARTGILEGNPIHKDMVAAAKMAKLAYIVNVVIDEDKKIVAAFAGNPFTAHEKGCAFLRPYCTVAAKPADIVITTNGGAPLDQNIYQCVKGMTAAEATCREGGVIIFCGECADGHGGVGFYTALRDCESAEELLRRIEQVPQDQTTADQWQYQILARVLVKHPVIFVTRPELKEMIEEMKFIYAESLDEAMEKANAMKGNDASVTVIPNGVSIAVQ